MFVRSLVGLDRQAAKDALGNFLTGTTLNANQIEFTNLVGEPDGLFTPSTSINCSTCSRR